MNKKLFILRDKAQNKLMFYQEYDTTENIDIEIITDYPEIKQYEDKDGRYILNEEGNIAVEYVDLPKSEFDILKEENEDLKQKMCELQEILAGILLEGVGNNGIN